MMISNLERREFTHMDISNYTYMYFFEPELALLEGNIVSEYFLNLQVAGSGFFL